MSSWARPARTWRARQPTWCCSTTISAPSWPPSTESSDVDEIRRFLTYHLTDKVAVLGPAEAVMAILAFLVVLIAGGWTLGEVPTPALLATASGAAFTAIVLGQLANTFACRSESSWIGRVGLAGNRLLLYAVAFEVAMLATFLLVPPLPGLLGGTTPSTLGWTFAALVVPVVWFADAADKALRERGRRSRRSGS